jgi:ribonuclease III
MKVSRQLAQLQSRIGYEFRDPSLLRESMVHPSYLPEHPGEKKHNQRLEFLGDAVLDLILSERLFALFPDEREGQLTQYRAILAKGRFLSDLARELGLPKCLLMSKAEIQNEGHLRPSSLEDAFEALVGAIYLDSSFSRVKEVVLSWYGDLEQRVSQYAGLSNPKGRLQELIQPEFGNDAIEYRTCAIEGEAHDRSFEIELLVNGQVEAKGRGKSKKEAEEKAAAEALRKRAAS